MSQTLSSWSLFLDSSSQVNLRTQNMNFVIHSVTKIGPKSWRIFSAPGTSVLCILTDHVRYEQYPDFVIRHPGIISSFFMENSVKIN